MKYWEFIIGIHDCTYIRNIVNIMFRRYNNCLYKFCHFFLCVWVCTAMILTNKQIIIIA